jgi:hypothetical protein
MNADQGLFDSLYHSAAVVGLNTSAMIEAAIVGRGVYTIESSEFAGGQTGTLHFHYLLVENGGIVSPATTFAEHCRQLALGITGDQAVIERSRRFVESFVRPRGIDRPATPEMVNEIERVAALRKRPHRTPAWHYPLRSALFAAANARFALR